MSKRELLNYLIENNMGIPIPQIVLSMALTVLLSLFVYWVYKKTYNGVMYSKNFNVTIILISTVTAMVMMVIGSNLALSLGMVGALSIIRFRASIKDPKDIAFLFWGIGVGLSCGTGIYIVGIVGSVFIACILFILNRGLYDESCYLLIIKGEKIDFKSIEDIIGKYTKMDRIRMKNSTHNTVEATYEVRLKGEGDTKLLKEIYSLQGVKNVNLVSYNGEIAG
ncbi:DUF4956 domain-containing protein [Clostridium culturomicium]|uniref:DUF4956 domain-containing protein n=1 Tax=Clostridium culturomicium TaxID=1499683 RepID=UPI0038578C48